jgi:hypothetical protein
MNKIALRMPHHNVISDKFTTNKLNEQEQKKVSLDKLLAVKEATEYIRNGETVPFELLFHVNISEIRKSIENEENEKINYKENLERFTKDSEIYGNVFLLSPKIQMISKAMKAKIELIKMQNPSYTDELKYTYIAPIKRVADKLFVEDTKIFEMLNQNVINTDVNEFELKENEYFNPLTVQRNMDSVTFKDEVTGEDIYVKINNQNIPKIIAKFGALDTKEAKEYIKPLYEEAAYTIGYLKANTNMSGFLSKEEAKDLKNIAVLDKNAQITKYVSLNEYYNNDRVKTDKFIYRFGFVSNMNEFINKTIENDKNLDMNISFKSIYGDKSLDVITAIKDSSQLDIVDMNKYANNSFKRFFAFDGSVKVDNA